jgi:hypothetical protein
MSRGNQSVSGIAGQELQVVPGEVELALAEDGTIFRWTARVDFASDDGLPDAAAILGHAGCLRYFRATFDGQRCQLDLAPTMDFPGTVITTN